MKNLFASLVVGFVLALNVFALTGCKHEVDRLPSDTGIEIKGETQKATPVAQVEHQVRRIAKTTAVGLAGVLTMLLIMAVPLACMRWIIPHIDDIGGVLLASVLCLGVAGLEFFASDAASRLGLIPWLLICCVVPAVAGPIVYLVSKSKVAVLAVYGLPVGAYVCFVVWSVFNWFREGLLAESFWMLALAFVLILILAVAGGKSEEAAAH